MIKPWMYAITPQKLMFNYRMSYYIIGCYLRLDRLYDPIVMACTICRTAGLHWYSWKQSPRQLRESHTLCCNCEGLWVMDIDMIIQLLHSTVECIHISVYNLQFTLHTSTYFSLQLLVSPISFRYPN